MILFVGQKRTVLIFYMISLLISLLVATWSQASGYKALPEGERAETAGWLFFYILLFTAILLALIHILRSWIKILVFALEVFLLFVSATFLLSLFLGDVSGVLWGLFISYGRLLLRKTDLVRNLSASIIGGVVGGLIGASLSIPTSLLLYVLLLTYDFVAVLVTGHMVKMVRSVEPFGEGGTRIGLGVGDLVVPSILASSLGSPLSTLLSIVGAMLGVVFTLRCLNRFKRPLPALPYIGAVQLPFTAISLYLTTLLP